MNTRSVPPKLRRFVDALEANGFEVSVSPDSIAHRWQRNGIVVDVMTSDGTGNRTNVRTSGHFETIPVKGATQAPDRSRKIPVSYPERSEFGNVPLPSLAAAIVIKSAAALIGSKHRSRHQTDVAFLFSIIGEDDLVPMRAELTKKDRQRIAAVSGLDDPSHEAWRSLGGRALDAQFCRSFLIGLPES